MAQTCPAAQNPFGGVATFRDVLSPGLQRAAGGHGDRCSWDRHLGGDAPHSAAGSQGTNALRGIFDLFTGREIEAPRRNCIDSDSLVRCHCMPDSVAS